MTTTKAFSKTMVGWGLGLWFLGYALSIGLFMFVPVSLLGWIIMPIGVVAAWWVLRRKIEGKTLRDYLVVGGVWAVIAIVFDYLFIVKMLKPADGYYKLDVYLYYGLTLMLPMLAWLLKQKSSRRMK